jgi:integrase
VNLDWSSLLLDFEDGSGFLWFDKTKNGRDASWALDPGTAEALRRWKKVCPSETWVFPELALPPGHRKPRGNRPMYLSHLSDELRAWLQACGVKRPKLFERSEHRIPLRAHDLRATFVTLALANGKTEAWVMKRTGHTTSIMLNRYRRVPSPSPSSTLGGSHPCTRLSRSLRQ